VVLAAATVTVGTVAPAAAGPQSSARSASTQLLMPGWSDDLHTQFGISWPGGPNGVMATHSINSSGSFSPTDHVFAPTMYPGGISCIEVSTVYHSDGAIHLMPHSMCGGGWQPGWVVDAAFRDKYVRDSDYTIKIELTDAGTNEWTASLLNFNTWGWDAMYTDAGVHDGDASGGWDLFEIYAYYNPNTTVADYCDRLAGYEFSTKNLYFKVGSTWTVADTSNTNRYDDDDPDHYGCPGLTLQWDGEAAYSVSNAPLGCTVHPVINNVGANFTLAVQLTNPNAYHINGWTLKIVLTGTQTVTTALNAGFSQTGNIVTVTNSSGNSTITSSGGTATFALQGTYTGPNTNPSIFFLDTGYTPNTCTVV
jgi:hypothetical protein